MTWIETSAITVIGPAVNGVFGDLLMQMDAIDPCKMSEFHKLLSLSPSHEAMERAAKGESYACAIEASPATLREISTAPVLTKIEFVLLLSSPCGPIVSVQITVPPNS